MGRLADFRLRRAREKKRKESHKIKTAERYSPDIATGLTDKQVAERIEDNLVNIKPINRSKSYGRIVFENVFSFCNIVTLTLMVLLCCIGAADYAVSSSIIIISMAIGIAQEIKAKKSVEKLSLTVESTCKVIRDGVSSAISTKQLVLDDIYIVEAGAQTPVDSSVEDGYVEVDESILTGESAAVRKEKGDYIMAGSIVLEGEAVVRADRVGKDCYIESVARVARKVERPKSRIFVSIDNFIKVITIALAVLAVLLTVSDRLAAGSGSWSSWRETIITVSSSVLGMIPVGMFLITSTALAVSVLKLSRHNALPQDLYSIEMLARVDTLLLDKTGTITDGNLEVAQLDLFGISEEEAGKVIRTFSIATKDKKSTALALDRKFGEGETLEYTDVRSFSSARKFSAVTLADGYSYLLGAPDYIAVCGEREETILSECSARGRRSIMLARYKGTIEEFAIERSEPLCIFALEDTLRTDVKETLDWFHNNDVDIKIISGDNADTVSNIAAKTGVYNADRRVNCRDISEQELDAAVEDNVVFGRVSPEQKYDIVRSLQKRGKIVGMIGDGVNDVKALKEADCSISFGSANEVARNISRIVLTGNNFTELPRIVNEGRSVIGNIEKVASMYIMKNIFIMALTLIYAIIGFIRPDIRMPFTTKNWLLIEFFVIGVPSIAFAIQPGTQRRIKGNFMRNVLGNAVPAAASLLAATGFILIITAHTAFTGVDAAEQYHYAVSLATIAMTSMGYICLVIISMPPSLYRSAVTLVMIGVGIAGIYMDHYLFKGTFLDCLPIRGGAEVGWILAAVAIGGAAYAITKLIHMGVEGKLGGKMDELLLKLHNKLRFKSK